MKKIKEYEKLIDKLVRATVKKGLVDEKKVISHVKSLKTLPRLQGIMALEIYLRKIRLEKQKTTLTIESAIPLSSSEIKNLTVALKSKHLITSVESVINPLIYGGLRIKIGDVIYDNSVAERILQVSEEIKS